jgi:hypothetical protein
LHGKNPSKKVVKEFSVTIISAGYTLGFAGTFHSAQGSTIDRVIVDLNKNPLFSRALTLPVIYVALTRVHNGKFLRLLPQSFSHGFKHLTKMKHMTTLGYASTKPGMMRVNLTSTSFPPPVTKITKIQQQRKDKVRKERERSAAISHTEQCTPKKKKKKKKKRKKN